MRILIVDDHLILRRGIKSILEELPDIDSIFEATNGNEAIKTVREQGFDLVLLDISMPGKDGLVHISQISNERVEKVSDKLAEGDAVRVKVLEVDRQGRVRLSMKEVDAA